VQWQGPAYEIDLTVGNQIIAVDGVAYDPDRLRDAVKSAKDATDPVEILVKDSDRYRTVRFDYHGGLRYPHFERDPSVPASLDDILTPRK
jgi:predicted metalloprotease with PDZ domain